MAALLAFAESGVEAVALEAGLGGRLDATNVVKRAGRRAHQHRARAHRGAGDTREQIFAEKAAVIKGGDAVFGELDGLEDEARRVCSAAGARAALPARLAASPGDLAVTGRSPATSPSTLAAGAGARSAGPASRVPTPALYQVTNAGLAVAAVRLLLGGLDEAAARQALAGTAVPGRLQMVAERPLRPRRRRPQPRRRARARPRASPPCACPARDRRAGDHAGQGLPGDDRRFLPLLDASSARRRASRAASTAEELAAAAARPRCGAAAGPWRCIGRTRTPPSPVRASLAGAGGCAHRRLAVPAGGPERRARRRQADRRAPVRRACRAPHGGRYILAQISWRGEWLRRRRIRPYGSWSRCSS